MRPVTLNSDLCTNNIRVSSFVIDTHVCNKLHLHSWFSPNMIDHILSMVISAYLVANMLVCVATNRPKMDMESPIMAKVHRMCWREYGLVIGLARYGSILCCSRVYRHKESRRGRGESKGGRERGRKGEGEVRKGGREGQGVGERKGSKALIYMGLLLFHFQIKDPYFFLILNWNR